MVTVVTVVCSAGNVMHLVSSGGQHHLISQPAQVALIHTVSQAGSSAASTGPAPASPGLAMPLNAAQGTAATVACLCVTHK